MELKSQITESFSEKELKCHGYHGNSTEPTNLDVHDTIKNSQFRSTKKHKTLKTIHILKCYINLLTLLIEKDKKNALGYRGNGINARGILCCSIF